MLWGKTDFIKKHFKMNLHDWIIFFLVMLGTSSVCMILQNISNSDFHVPMIFVLGVLVISLMTEGYFYGIFGALISVFAVNWAFTYPYFKMNFSIYGYPLTFMTMLTVGVATSTLMSMVKEQEKLRHESEKERMRANLLRAISHDLRTPLTSISGSISAVLENGTIISEEERKELLSDARKDADWLCKMVENLLSITRINGDNTTIKKENEVLEEVLSEAVYNFKKKNPGIDVSVTVPDDLIFVPMDAMLIEQLIINLLDNAVIHGVTTSKIKINAVTGAEYATVTVANDGKKINDRILNHLFDGTLQTKDEADNTRSMGIGLLVCKTIVAAHGGDITAQNLNDNWVSFTFTLKLGGENNYNPR